MPIEVIVCGGRDYDDNATAYQALDTLKEQYGIRLVVTGGARGADYIAAQWASSHGIPLAIVPAHWKAFGKHAGPKRNWWMLKFFNCCTVAAFPGGKGTENMKVQARERGLRILAWTDLLGWVEE